jgi:hypothetical protein
MRLVAVLGHTMICFRVIGVEGGADRHSAGVERLETDSTPATARLSTVRHGPPAIRAH